jgi:hypothetical protein
MRWRRQHKCLKARPDQGPGLDRPGRCEDADRGQQRDPDVDHGHDNVVNHNRRNANPHHDSPVQPEHPAGRSSTTSNGRGRPDVHHDDFAVAKLPGRQVRAILQGKPRSVLSRQDGGPCVLGVRRPA